MEEKLMASIRPGPPGKLFETESWQEFTDGSIQMASGSSPIASSARLDKPHD
jgi:hypothetical protein